jgi:hypothetical protein
MASDARDRGTHNTGRIEEEIGDLLGERALMREERLDQMEGRTEQDLTRAEKAVDETPARRAKNP